MASERREIMIGLISPIGINLDDVISTLSQSLNVVGYNTNAIRLTDFLTEMGDQFDLSYNSEFERYQKFISAGDALCERTQRKDVFALYGITRIVAHFPKRRDETPSEIAHILRQIKRLDEIRTLREVYGSNIIFVACHASRQQRVNNLVTKLLSSERSQDRDVLEARALEIISKDANERDNPNGQRVLDCFSHADFVLDCSSHDKLLKSCERFTHAFFGHPFITPRPDEYCAHVAKSAAFRSSDLSRQVGAAIFGDSCEIISMGCNEVPAHGGGTYWDGSSADDRDFRRGYDSNHKVKTDMVRDFMVRLSEEGWLSEKHSQLAPDALVESALEGKGPLARAMINDVIEYGRMVHAEMNALTDAARFRRSTSNATLFCTTMPCHLCTKLIIAAGITRVVYIEPYYKSLVGELYEDSVSMNEPFEHDKVSFEQLKGVTPNSFKQVFSKGRRKNGNGEAIRWNPRTAEPINTSSIPFYIQSEQIMVAKLGSLQKLLASSSPKPKKRPSRNNPRGATPRK